MTREPEDNQRKYRESNCRRMTRPQQQQQKPRCRVNWQKPYRAGVICNYVNEQTNECSQGDSSRCPCGGIVRIPAFASHTNAQTLVQPVTNPFTDAEWAHIVFRLNECRCDTCKVISVKLCDMRDAGKKQPPAPAADALLDIINRGKSALYEIEPDGNWSSILQAKMDVLCWVEEEYEAALRQRGEQHE